MLVLNYHDGATPPQWLTEYPRVYQRGTGHVVDELGMINVTTATSRLAAGKLPFGWAAISVEAWKHGWRGSSGNTEQEAVHFAGRVSFIAAMLRKIFPAVRIVLYSAGVPINVDPPVVLEDPNDMRNWQARNDLHAMLIAPHVDAFGGDIYPRSVDPAKVKIHADLHIGELRRLASRHAKLALPFIWDCYTGDVAIERKPVSAEVYAALLDSCVRNGADGCVHYSADANVHPQPAVTQLRNFEGIR